jgi:hypothetical protein
MKELKLISGFILTINNKNNNFNKIIKFNNLNENYFKLENLEFEKEYFFKINYFFLK